MCFTRPLVRFLRLGTSSSISSMSSSWGNSPISSFCEHKKRPAHMSQPHYMNNTGMANQLLQERQERVGEYQTLKTTIGKPSFTSDHNKHWFVMAVGNVLQLSGLQLLQYTHKKIIWFWLQNSWRNVRQHVAFQTFIFWFN